MAWGRVTSGAQCGAGCSARARQCCLTLHRAMCHIHHVPCAMCHVSCAISTMCHVPCATPIVRHGPHPIMCHMCLPMCHVPHPQCAPCHIHSVPHATCHIPLPWATSVVCLMSRPIVFLLPCHLPHLVTSHCVPHCHTMMCPFPLCANTMCLPMPSATSHPVPCATSHSVLRSTPCHGTPCPPPTLCHSVPRHTPRCASCHLMLPSHAIPRATLLCHIPSHTLHTPSHPLCPSSPHAVPRCAHSVSLHPPPDLTFLSGYCQSVPKFV